MDYDYSISFVITRSSKKKIMAIEHEDGEQSQLNENEDMATMIANMRARLEEHARMIDQQATLIQNLQQQ